MYAYGLPVTRARLFIVWRRRGALHGLVPGRVVDRCECRDALGGALRDAAHLDILEHVLDEAAHGVGGAGLSRDVLNVLHDKKM